MDEINNDFYANTDRNIETGNNISNTTVIDPQFKKIINQNVVRVISGVVPDTLAATAASYGNFFVADRAYFVLSITEVHRTNGSSNATLNIEKCASGVAPDSGVTLLASNLSMTTSASTPRFPSLTTTKADLILKKGDRLILKDGGTLTSLNDVCVTIVLIQL